MPCPYRAANDRDALKPGAEALGYEAPSLQDEKRPLNVGTPHHFLSDVDYVSHKGTKNTKGMDRNLHSFVPLCEKKHQFLMIQCPKSTCLCPDQCEIRSSLYFRRSCLRRNDGLPPTIVKLCPACRALIGNKRKTARNVLLGNERLNRCSVK